MSEDIVSRKRLRAYFADVPKKEDKPKRPILANPFVLIIAWGASLFVIIPCVMYPIISFNIGIEEGVFVLACGGVISILGIILNGVYGQVNRTYKNKLSEFEENKQKRQSKFEDWEINEQDIVNLPTENQIDNQLIRDLNQIVNVALKKLDLEYFNPNNTSPSDNQLIRQPLVIYGPILGSRAGIPDREAHALKVGNDNVIRFGTYEIAIVCLSNTRIATYTCYYRFLKDSRVSERTDEYLYQDVVSVSTRDVPSNIEIAGKTISRARVFKLTVPSGDNIEVNVGIPDIRELFDADYQSSSDYEESVRVIREMLREKKG